MTDHFSRNVMISLAGHGTVLVLIFVRAVLVPTAPIEIRNAIRVDVVALPEKMTETPVLLPPEPEPAKVTPVETKPEPKPEAEAKPAPTKPKVDPKKAQSDAIKKLQAMAAIDKIKQDVSKAKESKPSTVVKGNQVSEGNSFTGLARIEYDRYFDDLQTKVRAQWSVPQWLIDGNYKAQVQILVDERGYVTKKVMRRSSGNDAFDAQVFAAIDASSPLPPPPARLQGMLATSGIILNFPE